MWIEQGAGTGQASINKQEWKREYQYYYSKECQHLSANCCCMWNWKMSYWLTDIFNMVVILLLTYQEYKNPKSDKFALWSYLEILIIILLFLYVIFSEIFYFFGLAKKLYKKLNKRGLEGLLIYYMMLLIPGILLFFLCFTLAAVLVLEGVLYDVTGIGSYYSSGLYGIWICLLAYLYLTFLSLYSIVTIRPRRFIIFLTCCFFYGVQTNSNNAEDENEEEWSFGLQTLGKMDESADQLVERSSEKPKRLNFVLLFFLLFRITTGILGLTVLLSIQLY